MENETKTQGGQVEINVALAANDTAAAANDPTMAANDDAAGNGSLEKTEPASPPSDMLLVSAERRPPPFTWHEVGAYRLPDAPFGERARRARSLGFGSDDRRTRWLFAPARRADREQLSGEILNGFAMPDRRGERALAQRLVRETLAELPLLTRRAFRSFTKRGSLEAVGMELGLAAAQVAALVETAADMVVAGLREEEIDEGFRDE